MTKLIDRRQEAFAQHRANGATLEDAYEMAGFIRNSSHASRMAAKPKVAARIGELRARNGDVQEANLQRTIAALLQVAEDSQDFDTPARMRETRITLLEAHRLQRELMEMRRAERDVPALPRATRPKTPARKLPGTAPASAEPSPEVPANRPVAPEIGAEPTANAPKTYPDLPETYPSPRRLISPGNAFYVPDWLRMEG